MISGIYLVGIIWADDEGINVSSFVIFTFDVLLDKMVFSFIIENNMNTFGGVTTNVWTKHNVVFGFAVHVLGSNGRWENLEKKNENVVILKKNILKFLIINCLP